MMHHQMKTCRWGIDQIYSRYKRLGDNVIDENYFPIVWQQDGYRTVAIDNFISPS